MGFCSEGRLASTNHRFPHCDLVLQHIPCHRTPAPNNLPGFNSFKGPAIKSHNGLGSRLANKLQGDTSETKLTSKHSRHCPTEGFILGSHFQRFLPFLGKYLSHYLCSHNTKKSDKSGDH